MQFSRSSKPSVSIWLYLHSPWGWYQNVCSGYCATWTKILILFVLRKWKWKSGFFDSLLCNQVSKRFVAIKLAEFYVLQKFIGFPAGSCKLGNAQSCFGSRHRAISVDNGGGRCKQGGLVQGQLCQGSCCQSHGGNCATLFRSDGIKCTGNYTSSLLVKVLGSESKPMGMLCNIRFLLFLVNSTYEARKLHWNFFSWGGGGGGGAELCVGNLLRKSIFPLRA